MNGQVLGIGWGVVVVGWWGSWWWEVVILQTVLESICQRVCECEMMLFLGTKQSREEGEIEEKVW